PERAEVPPASPTAIAQQRQTRRAVGKFEQQGRAFCPEMAGRDTVPGGCLKERGGLILAREGVPYIDRTEFHETGGIMPARPRDDRRMRMAPGGEVSPEH